MTDVSDDRFIIADIKAREILDSRGNPTVEVDVITKGGVQGRASVPSGASRGVHEAVEIRDGDYRFKGKGVLRAVKNVIEIIKPALIGIDVRNQYEIDMKLVELDGTPNKSKLGANAILAVSLAIAKAAAMASSIPLYKYLAPNREKYLMPIPFQNVINGGKHAGNELAIQEFMIVPIGANTFKEALRYCAEVYYTLRDLLLRKYGKNAINVGDEGGFAPPLRFSQDALDLLVKSIEQSGYIPGKDLALAIDAAASEFFNEKSGTYTIDDRTLTPCDLRDYYVELVKTYPIISIEDPFQQEDFEGFASLTKKIGDKVQIVGDDLFTTNPKRLEMGVRMGACNALLLKVNQIGTLSEALITAKIAMKNDYAVMVSHRSGETEDTFIADLAVALCTGQIKAGAPARGERTAKYNQLLRIEEELGSRAIYPKGRLNHWKEFFTDLPILKGL